MKELVPVSLLMEQLFSETSNGQPAERGGGGGEGIIGVTLWVCPYHNSSLLSLVNFHASS